MDTETDTGSLEEFQKKVDEVLDAREQHSAGKITLEELNSKEAECKKAEKRARRELKKLNALIKYAYKLVEQKQASK